MMMTFSGLSLTWPPGSLYFLKCSRVLVLPPGDPPPQLQPGDDAGRDRQPESHHAVHQHGREDDRPRDPEQDERRDHPRVDRARPTRRGGDQVRRHPDEEALDEDAEVDAAAE